MMKAVRWALSAAVASAFLFGGQVLAAPPPTNDTPEEPPRLNLPLEATVTNPDWDRKPTGEELYQLYPPLAQILELEGHANITCVVETDGSLKGCKVISETPTGLGFGYATLLAAVDFHMKPQLVDGRPVKSSVTIPLAWKLAENFRPQVLHPETPTGPTPSPEAMALARRLVAALDVRGRTLDYFDKWTETQIQAMEKNGGPAPAPDQENLVKGLLHRGYMSATLELTEQQARIYAIEMPVSQLSEAVRFFEGPTGRAYRQTTHQLETEGSKAVWVYSEAHAQARAAFCAQTACQK